MRPLPTQLSATPPARHRSRMPVSRCANAAHLQHHFFGDVLNRSREIHLALRQLGSRAARAGPPNSRSNRSAGHRQAVRVGEVLHVHPQAAVVADLDQVILDGLDVLRLAVRRQAHHLVFAGVDLEAGEVGERRVQQAERVRKAQLRAACSISLPRPTPIDDVAHSPTPSIVTIAACFERRRIERRRGVRLVMLAEQHFARRSLRAARRMSSAIQSFSPSHSGIAIRYDRSRAARRRCRSRAAGRT